MSDDSERDERIKGAIGKYLKRQDPREHRRNNSPEADLIKEALMWLRDMGWNLDVVESKATFSQELQKWIQQTVRAGFSDTVGSDPFGHAAYIEWKAPGKRSTLRQNQYEFLKEKIERKCFAIVADSKRYVVDVYRQWKNHRPGTEASINFLLDQLPVPVDQNPHSQSLDL